MRKCKEKEERGRLMLNMFFKKILLIFFINTSLSYANPVYDENLIRIQSIAYPKLITADKKLKDKLSNKLIELTILYNEIDSQVAKKYKKIILKKYNFLGKYKIKIKLKKYKDFNYIKPLSTAYLLLKSEEKDIQKISDFLYEEKRISFSYDLEYVENGVMMSLEISSKINIILNKKYIETNKIELKNSIFGVVKLR